MIASQELPTAIVASHRAQTKARAHVPAKLSKSRQELLREMELPSFSYDAASDALQHERRPDKRSDVEYPQEKGSTLAQRSSPILRSFPIPPMRSPPRSPLPDPPQPIASAQALLVGSNDEDSPLTSEQASASSHGDSTSAYKHPDESHELIWPYANFSTVHNGSSSSSSRGRKSTTASSVRDIDLSLQLFLHTRDRTQDQLADEMVVRSHESEQERLAALFGSGAGSHRPTSAASGQRPGAMTKHGAAAAGQQKEKEKKGKFSSFKKLLKKGTGSNTSVHSSQGSSPDLLGGSERASTFASSERERDAASSSSFLAPSFAPSFEPVLEHGFIDGDEQEHLIHGDQPQQSKHHPRQPSTAAAPPSMARSMTSQTGSMPAMPRSRTTDFAAVGRGRACTDPTRGTPDKLSFALPSSSPAGKSLSASPSPHLASTARIQAAGQPQNDSQHSLAVESLRSSSGSTHLSERSSIHSGARVPLNAAPGGNGGSKGILRSHTEAQPRSRSSSNSNGVELGSARPSSSKPTFVTSTKATSLSSTSSAKLGSVRGSHTSQHGMQDRPAHGYVLEEVKARGSMLWSHLDSLDYTVPLAAGDNISKLVQSPSDFHALYSLGVFDVSQPPAPPPSQLHKTSAGESKADDGFFFRALANSSPPPATAQFSDTSLYLMQEARRVLIAEDAADEAAREKVYCEDDAILLAHRMHIESLSKRTHRRSEESIHTVWKVSTSDTPVDTPREAPPPALWPSDAPVPM